MGDKSGLEMIQLIKRDHFLAAGRVLEGSIGWRGVKMNEYLKQSPPHHCGQATGHVWEKPLLHKWPSPAHTGATGLLTFPSSQPHFPCSEVCYCL